VDGSDSRQAGAVSHLQGHTRRTTRTIPSSTSPDRAAAPTAAAGSHSSWTDHRLPSMGLADRGRITRPWSDEGRGVRRDGDRTAPGRPRRTWRAQNLVDRSRAAATLPSYCESWSDHPTHRLNVLQADSDPASSTCFPAAGNRFVRSRTGRRENGTQSVAR
jgi:hypothetical protein